MDINRINTVKLKPVYKRKSVLAVYKASVSEDRIYRQSRVEQKQVLNEKC